MSKQSPSPDAHEASTALDVAVVGAGPTGLMIANLLGLHGLNVRVLEAGGQLIDYPRGVGMDDETLRTFQTAGLVADVLPHTVPHQVLAFVDRMNRDLARMAPTTGEFGWPRRNGFVQPLADRVLLEGLDRFDHVDVEWGSEVTGLCETSGGVDISVRSATGERVVRAAYVVGADGGRSVTRKSLGLRFEGSSASASWLVVDIRNDPLGRPGAYVNADPSRPYVSLSIPHGIRRFEFMLLPGETAEQADTDDFVRGLLQPLVPNGSTADIIRRRVYTHHSRMAESFRVGRVFLIGDAAHVMPVWQGQGYNSGIRDAFNLSWKLAMRIRGLAGDAVLDSYELERRSHVRAMMQLSTWVGKVVSIRNRPLAGLRDAFFRCASAVPSIKNYVVQMRFKPMPTMDEGALTTFGSTSMPAVAGRLFIQPTVATRAAGSIKLDDALGPWFALLAWNNDPREILDADALACLAQIGVRLVTVRPVEQLDWNDEGGAPDDVLVVGDLHGLLKGWFDSRPESVVLLRPDRIVGGASEAHAASEMVRDFHRVIGGTPVLDPSLDVCQEHEDRGDLRYLPASALRPESRLPSLELGREG